MKKPATVFQDAIDLRVLLSLLLHRIHWVAGITVVCLIAAFLATYALPRRYQSQSFVIFIKPDVIYSFDPRITTQLDVPAGEGIPNLAQSSGIIRQAYQSLPEDEKATLPGDLDMLRSNMSASISNNVMRLSVLDTNAQASADLANAWADSLVANLNTLYVPASASSSQFDNQATAAYQTWKQAQQDLITFEKTNQGNILKEKLQALETGLAGSLQAQTRLDTIVSDAQAIQQRLQSAPAADQTDIMDELSMLIMSANALGGGPATTAQAGSSSTSVASGSGQSPLGLSIQLPSNSFNATVGSRQAFLTSFIDSLNKRQTIYQEQAASQQRAILVVQGELAQAQAEETRLQNGESIAQESYVSLQRKAQETRFSMQEEDIVARVASRASAPVSPVSSHRLLLTLLGGALGAFASILYILFMAWWKETPEHLAQEGS